MPSVRHRFSIDFDPTTTLVGSYSLGIRVADPADLESIASAAGLSVKGDKAKHIEVDLAEGDPKLALLYSTIEARFNLKPSPSRVVPADLRQSYFGLRREVTWSESEINACALLQLQASLLIADHETPNEDQLAREEYVARAGDRGKTAVQLGSISPFPALAVAEPLRTSLLGSGLAALYLPPVVFPAAKPVRKPLWALRSHVILPPALNPLLGERGTVVPPNTEWWCWWDDEGRNPPTLRYDRRAVEALGSFDIALTAERVGTTRFGACRLCIVTQKFRAALSTLKVKGVNYVPVEFMHN